MATLVVYVGIPDDEFAKGAHITAFMFHAALLMVRFLLAPILDSRHGGPLMDLENVLWDGVMAVRIAMALLGVNGVRIFHECPHQYVSTTLFTPTNCKACTHFIWGLRKQAMQCKRCKRTVHQHCHRALVHESPHCKVGTVLFLAGFVWWSWSW